MATLNTEQIRNVALVGHRSCGKTSLAEAAMFVSGMTERLGAADGGTTVTDFIPEEQARNLSISDALCFVQHEGTKINIIDTPGYAEFYSEVIPALWVADGAVLLLDGVAGVEVQTRRVYAEAKASDTPMVAVVNKLDKEHASFSNAVDMISEGLPDCRPVVVQLPIGSEEDLSGTVDLMTSAFTWTVESGLATPA